MSKASLNSLLLVFGLGLISCGCGEQKKEIPATPAVPSIKTDSKVTNSPSDELKPESSQKTTLAPTDPDSGNPGQVAKPDKSASRNQNAKPAMAAKAAAKANKAVRPFTEAAYLPDEVVAIMVAHPKQFTESPVGKLITELGLDDSSPLKEIVRRSHVKLEDIERVTVFFDQAFVDTFARQAGLEIGDAAADEKPALDQNQLKNSLKQIGLAFHNYHDTFLKFPRADGDGDGLKTGLSWRVHLLPFLDEAPLYNQFHMDEAWDSDHNKTLISQMPMLFRSPGVTDDEKTAFHVFTGENTPFHGDKGLGIRNFTDGTSNTILAVLAGSDTAEIWTKPGGLEVNLTAPKKALGELKDESFLVLLADGSVRTIPTSIDVTMLANLIQPADGNVVDIGPPAASSPELPSPSMIFSLVTDANQAGMAKELLGEPTEESHDGQSFLKNQTMALWFPDVRTVVMGGIESVKQMISRKKSGKSSDSSLIEQLQTGADYSVAIDVQSQAPLIQQAVQINQMLGMILNVETLAAHLSVTAEEGESLLEINVTALDAQMAAGLSAMATIGLNQAKMAAMQIQQAPNPGPDGEKVQAMLKQVISSAAVDLNGDKIQFRITAPEGFDNLPELLKPAMTKARAAATEVQRKNSLKQMGLAFHNFESVSSTFPGAGRRDANSPVGLSWRVYVLPFLDQAALYNQFKLDEPWDSEHNRTLIEQMPPVFKSPGVEDPQKTSFHVFTGPGSPFADDHTPRIADFTDGMSSTLLVVLAGPDTAEIWTMPGGLDFDPKDPIKALGDFVGDTFLALFADGSARTIDKNISAPTLRRLIQHADGEPLE